MSKRYFRLTPLLCVILLALPLEATATKYAADFMTKGTGGRPLAMGGAFTAVGGDNNSLFFNPGALAAMPGGSISLMHSERFGGLVQVDHVGFHRKMELYGREASLGISVLRLGVDDIQFTGTPEDHGWVPDHEEDTFGPEDFAELDIDPSLFHKVSDQEWGILGVYATKVGNWSMGGSVKVIYQSIGTFNSFGFGLDAGILSPPLAHGFRAGIKLQDITGTYIAWSTGVSEFVAPSLRPGLAWRHGFESLRADLLLAADAEIRFEDYGEAATFSGGGFSMDPHLGLELWLLKAVALRLGLDGEAWTAGGGLRLAGARGILPWDLLEEFSVDYGFGSHEDLDGTHRLGLAIHF